MSDYQLVMFYNTRILGHTYCNFFVLCGGFY